MSETEPTVVVDKETKHSSRKRIRHRKKLLYEKLMKQMEFYFSDASLSKDRLMGQMVKNDPYIPLEVFLKFNKIKSMTNDVNDIAKAMKNSSMLELSEDKTKVRRISEILPYDADARTVYVESIPATATLEWMQRVFQEYGNVAYISLPKFKDSRRIKGYAFVEFEKPEDAQKCLGVFSSMGCVLPTNTSPEEITSIKTYTAVDPATNPHEQKDKEESEPPRKKAKKVREKKPPKSLDLKLGEHENESNHKKLNTPDEAETPVDEVRTSDAESKCDASHDESNKLGHDEANKTEGSSTKKKRRKKTAKEKSKTRNGVNEREAAKAALWGLQVLPKSAWKALRNQYLQLQRLPRYKRPRHSEHTGDAGDAAGMQQTVGPVDVCEGDTEALAGVAAPPQPSATHIRFDDDDH